MATVQPIRDRSKIESMKKILKAESPRNLLLFTFGLNVGLRITDILNFKLSDILDKKGNIVDLIQLYEAKTGKHKRFPINKTVKKAIQSYLDSLESYNMDDYLFKSRQGDNKPLTRFMAYRILNSAANQVGIEDMGTHSMRKTFGYFAYKAGTDITLLMDIFNHSSPQITLRYIGITQDQKDQVYINIEL